MLLDSLQRAAAERERLSLTRSRRIAHSACSVRQAVAPRVAPPAAGDVQAPVRAPVQALLSFSSNDYLGLANHPRVVAAFAEGVMRWGAGSGASHLVSGHALPHRQLEQQLADWYRPFIPEVRTLLFCSGYMANVGVLTALGGADATLFCETLNHASLIDGARLARAAVQRYPHRDVDALDAALASCTTPIKLIVTDAVFSMDGAIAPLPALLALAERHDAWLIVDDAHGFGVLGEQGRGVPELLGLASQRLIYIGTLGKAAGVSGAFVAAHRTIVEHLVNTARTYIFTTASPPAAAHALSISLALIAGSEGQRRRQVLQRRIDALRAGLSPLLSGEDGGADAGGDGAAWQLADSITAIQPLIVGDNATALSLSQQLETQAGIRVGAIRPPTVPEGSARLRITLSAEHEEADVERLVAALTALHQASAASAASAGRAGQ